MTSTEQRLHARLDEVKPGCVCPRCTDEGFGGTPAVRARCDGCGDTRALLWFDMHVEDEPLVVSPRERAPSEGIAGFSERSRIRAQDRLLVDLAEGLTGTDRVRLACRHCTGRRGGHREFRPTIQDLDAACAKASRIGGTVVLRTDNTCGVKLPATGIPARR